MSESEKEMFATGKRMTAEAVEVTGFAIGDRVRAMVGDETSWEWRKGVVIGFWRSWRGHEYAPRVRFDALPGRASVEMTMKPGALRKINEPPPVVAALDSIFSHFRRPDDSANAAALAAAELENARSAMYAATNPEEYNAAALRFEKAQGEYDALLRQPDPTRNPLDAAAQIDAARTASEYKKALADDDLMREHCE